jgi:DNA sulfur modification protein DndD
MTFKDNEKDLVDKLEKLKIDRKKIQGASETKSEYELAEPYADLLIKATKRLKEKAYDRLVSEIESESNKLYYEYLKANSTSKGKIVIDKENSSVGIEDEGRSIILSKGLTTAAKMSVINSILYLSSQKIGRSYPLIADAPSSVFDAENTQMYTKKIGETFEQVIIMSKDYTDNELEKLSKEEHISNIWILESKEIDSKSKDKGRSNFKTYISKIK